jgi:membrane-bound ClpP family serine protease
MLAITLILIIIGIGLVLTILELFFIPGTTIVGFLGLIFSVAGILLAYDQFGNDVGMTVLVTTSIAKVVILYLSFHHGAWWKFSLKSAIESKVNEGLTANLKPGATGKTVSTLRPVGKAEFNNLEYEVKTSGNYLENNVPIRIIQVESNQIVVEPIN